MTKASNNEKRAANSLRSKECEVLHPIYLLVVFWGEEHRSFFAELLLPSLLAPGNLPAISSVRGSKLVVCTTKADWEALQLLPLLEEARQFVEPYWIEIYSPQPDANKYLHSAAGFKLAVNKCFEDGAYASFLIPDLILSDGTLKCFRESAAAGNVACLVPCLRYDLDACLSTLRARGLLKENTAIAIPGRELASIGLENFHSEIKRFEWTSPFFCREPFSVWWRLAGNTGIVLHTTGWQMGLVDFHALSTLNANSLEYGAHDQVFIYENFYRFKDTNELHLICDSDMVFYLSLTSERDMPFLPLKSYPLNCIPGLGPLLKFTSLRLFLNGPMFDPFRRWAATIPTFIHTTPLSDANRRQTTATCDLLRRATASPGRLLMIYDSLPTWRLLWSYIVLLYTQPGAFCAKLWRRITGQRRAATSTPQIDPQLSKAEVSPDVPTFNP